MRVDDHENPIAELRRIFNIWKEEALITKGYRLLDENNYEEAIAVGRKAVAQYPGNAECRYHLACYLSRGGMLDEAMRELGKAVAENAKLGPRAKLDPDFEPLWSRPGFHLITEAQ